MGAEILPTMWRVSLGLCGAEESWHLPIRAGDSCVIGTWRVRENRIEFATMEGTESLSFGEGSDALQVMLRLFVLMEALSVRPVRLIVDGIEVAKRGFLQ